MRAQVAEVTYVDDLEAAWQQHLAPREPDALTVVSTFAGCGGSSLGYSMAGFRELLAVEWDDNAVTTFRLNFPEVPVYHGDIAALSVEDACGLAGLDVGVLDVLDGSPPCQGFSTAGKRNLDDDRNQLFREFTRLLAGLQPRAFVMENVSGMVKGKMRLIFVDILRELKACGYRVSVRLLNAMYFGVPQSRQRLIFVGVREDLDGEPGYPKAVSLPQGAGVVITGVQNNPEELAWLFDAGRRFVAYQSWPDMKVGSSRQDLGLSGFNCQKWDPRKPAPTVRKNDGHVTMHGAMHWSERRRFTVPEFKRFGSFPDDFRFAGDWSAAVQSIGNSVPPLFMRAIATHLREAILTPAATLAL